MDNIQQIYLPARGRWNVKRGNISIICDYDFTSYYHNLIRSKFGIKNIITPELGAHITIISRKQSGFCATNKFSNYHGQPVNFSFDPRIIVGGGFRVPFKIFYSKVQIPQDIVNKINLTLWAAKSDSFKHFHLTFGRVSLKDWENRKVLTTQIISNINGL